MLKKVTPLIMIAAVSACSSQMERRQTNDDDTYLQAATGEALQIPDGLQQPRYSHEYDLPQLGNKANPELVGRSLDIRPPLQVLPMAEGTRLEEGSDNIKIVVESINNDVDLKQEIFATLKGFLAQQQIGIQAEDYDKGVLETDWIESSEVLDSSFWGSDEVYSLRQRYQYLVEVRPHGRSGNIVINLLEHEESYQGDNRDVVLSGEDKRRYTIDMLNRSIAYMSIKREQALETKRRQESMGIEMTLQDTETEPAYWLANAQFKQVWNRLRLVLPELGLEIAEMDSSKGLFYVNYADDSGFWSSLWGDTKLPLEKGVYRVLVKDAGEQTKLWMHDSEDKPLSDEQMTEIYKVLSEQMQEERNRRR
ncbi:outer membrane protein assembly factor BamC [Shewanella cyperi]|uniref:Outer membrane protein assembly factor BamC n=1 Tax=Shewanella cyperi TaxID=2814292 RepID=A0A974XWF8_9GAMM|nr:outer membrane protein assembly factor BamC [Shewanella cyperi]QSX31554.1 outer membrane protein assembly factor BamC [Shewanella cyperi]